MAYRYNEKTGEFEDLGNGREKSDVTHKTSGEVKKESNGWILAVVIIFAINFLAQLLTALQQG